MEPLKNELSAANALRIGAALRQAHAGFALPRYERGLHDALAPLELKQRVQCIATRIEECLPEDPRVMFPILTNALAAEEMRGFLVWPLTEIVARRGLGHFAESMRALRAMTGRFTSEFAIRPFLRAMPEKTLVQLHKWCGDPDHHVRRLASEGSRPFLPWGGNLPELLDPPHPTLGLLEKLHRDPSDYVRLSVSNHLNDISKRHPALVVETLARWKKSAPRNPHWEKLARHACRTLIKQGHHGALALHGFGGAESLEVVSLKLDRKTVPLGGSIGYELVVRNRSSKPLRALFDYAIHHRKADGSLSPKVFKGRVKPLAPGELWHIAGNHAIKPVTTRVYHAGKHVFEPRLNGMVCEGCGFKLTIA